MSCLNPGSWTPQLDITSVCISKVLSPGIRTGVSKRWSGQARAGWARPRVCLGTSKAGHALDEKFWRNYPFLKNRCRVIVEELRPWQDFLLLFCDSVQFSLVTQSCPALCDPMNRTTPGLPVHHQLPEFTQTHVHRVGDSIQPSHPLSSPSPPAPNPFQNQSLFQ